MATVLGMMELHALEKGFQYDAVILARPDIWFHVDTDLPRCAQGREGGKGERENEARGGDTDDIRQKDTDKTEEGDRDRRREYVAQI